MGKAENRNLGISGNRRFVMLNLFQHLFSMKDPEINSGDDRVKKRIISNYIKTNMAALMAIIIASSTMVTVLMGRLNTAPKQAH